MRRPSLSEQLDEYERTCEVADAMRTAAREEQALGRDHWLISGRIDGLRNALEIMRSGSSRATAEERIEQHISELMNLENRGPTDD